MDLNLLQENLENLSQNFLKETFVFDFLSVYEIPRSTIKLLKDNPTKLSGNENEVILKNKLLFHVTTLEEDEHVSIDTLQKEKNLNKFNPRFIIVTDFVTFLAVDTKTKETLDIQIGDLGKHYAFFLPWCGMEKSQHVNENPADIRAAYKMDKLYQAIVNDDPEYYKNNSHDLNIFLSRLLFCFFAEDTGIFPKAGMFTNSVNSHTHENGDEMDIYFSTLFDVLNTKDSDRSKFASHFLEFPYVNGGLFEINIKLPTFTASSRKLIIECGKLNWDSINPDIFGSMIQAVVHPGQRESLGMHYTSVPNIMKVIEPLFLNDLYEELENSKNDIKKLTKLRERICKIRIFDPACGSGNFLIISYKELTKLESKIIGYAKDLGYSMTPSCSGISLNSFYGIEIDDFAHEIARLSLWLAQHQMNQYFDGMFGIMKATLPLKESGKIVCDNATRADWEILCPRKDQVVGEYEIYVVGNPPYLGSRNQEDEQKEDLKNLFVNDYKSLDYISAWFYKGAKYVSGYENIKLAFVSTNSISQGEQVALLWPLILKENIEICFAHQSFKWKNLAKGNAGVTCVIIGLANKSTKAKRLYTAEQYRNVKNINPYLTEGNSSFITRRSSPLSKDLPQMTYGNLLNDGGNFVLTKEEKDGLIEKYPESRVLVRNYIGSQEFIRGQQRWCLFISEDQIALARSIPEINSRLNKIKALRSASTEKSTRAMADFPHRYYFLAHKETNSIIIPRTSSENRDYIPMGFLDNKTIISDAAQVIYNAEPYIFAILNSRMHMTWVRAVGGRLKTDLRYSSALCYNTFPFPDITQEQKKSLTTHVYNILEEREKNPEKIMADLYDPDKMPSGLRDAHKYLNQAIDQIYRSKPFESDEDRLTHLFKFHEDMITRETNKK